MQVDWFALSMNYHYPNPTHRIHNSFGCSCIVLACDVRGVRGVGLCSGIGLAFVWLHGLSRQACSSHFNLDHYLRNQKMKQIGRRWHCLGLSGKATQHEVNWKLTLGRPPNTYNNLIIFHLNNAQHCGESGQLAQTPNNCSNHPHQHCLHQHQLSKSSGVMIHHHYIFAELRNVTDMADISV